MLRQGYIAYVRAKKRYGKSKRVFGYINVI